jgi:nucleoside-diphosphate-sugar epimerase
MDRVLVTGATGFTGAHLTRSLVRDGHVVRVLARSAKRAREVLSQEVEVVEGDVADAGVVLRAVHGCQIVYHLAAAYREAALPDERYRAVHVTGTRLLLEAAQAEGVHRIVHCSTIGVLGHIVNPPADEETPYAPGDIYQRTKMEGEELALGFHQRWGLPLAVARPTAIYGPGDMRLLKLFSLIARRRFVILGSGEIYYHLVHVEDLVRGLKLLGSHPDAPGEIFILGGEGYRSLREILGLIAGIVGVPPPRIRLPALPFQMAGSLCEAVCIPLGVEPPIYRRRVDFFTKSRAFSIEKAKRTLGYQPQVDLEAGLRSTAEWYRAHGHLPPARG